MSKKPKLKSEVRDSSFPLADSPIPMVDQVKNREKAKAALDSLSKTTPPIVNRKP